MADESFLIAKLKEAATFNCSSWETFIVREIQDLEATKEKYREVCKKADNLMAEVEQLKAYADVLERQLSLASKMLSKTRKVKFPVYTKRRRGAQGWLKARNTIGSSLSETSSRGTISAS